MRSLKSRLFGFGVAAAFGTIVVVGCSASGETGDISPTDNEPDADKVIPVATDDSGTDKPVTKDGGKDAAKDASPKDAAKEAAPVIVLNPGDACPTVDAEILRACGKCGTQKALCLPNNTVSDYNACKDAEDAECEIGGVEDVSCGNCGMQKRTCNKYCQWTLGGCTGQPVNSCSPGSVQFTDASCTTANTYKNKLCQSTCTWGSLTTTCAAPPTSIAAPPNAGATNTTLVLMSSGQTLPRIPSGACPLTGTFSTAMPYTYIEVKNPNPKATSISVYTTKDPVAPAAISTYIAGYDGAAPAATEAARRVCKTGTNAVSYVSLSFPYKATVAPNSSVFVLIQATSATSFTGTGTMLLNVQTDSVAP